MSDATTVLVQTLASCLLTGLLGLLVLRAVRRRPVRLVLSLAALVPVLAVTLAVVVNVQTMVISVHDSQVVLTGLAVATVLAVALALVVGQWLVAGSRAVGRGLQGLGDDAGPPARRTPTPHVPAELAELHEELRSTQLRLDVSRRRERLLEDSRRELVSFLSHDLRTPLAGLRALAEGLEDGVVRDVPAALVQIRLSVDRVDGLVGDLFELSRLRADPEPGPLTTVSLRDVAHDMARECEGQARSAGVRLAVRCEDPLVVQGVAGDLARALSNLISNAVSRTAAGSAVLVQGSRDQDGRVRLAVTDGCGGIPEQDLPRVFDTGWRGNAERTPGDGRSGLGLAIAKGVAEAHAGTLEVANADGGCRFQLTLPAVAERAPGAGAAAP